MTGPPHDELPPRPIPPRPDECCGSGCPRCVYELYDEAVAEWERLVAERNKSLVGEASALRDDTSG